MAHGKLSWHVWLLVILQKETGKEGCCEPELRSMLLSVVQAILKAKLEIDANGHAHAHAMGLTYMALEHAQGLWLKAGWLGER